jgi:hypothetical protein
MNAQEHLKRTAECTRLAEATNDPGLREYLTKLPLSWMQSTTKAERNESSPADGPQRHRLMTVHDLFFGPGILGAQFYVWRQVHYETDRVRWKPFPPSKGGGLSLTLQELWP